MSAVSDAAAAWNAFRMGEHNGESISKLLIEYAVAWDDAVQKFKGNPAEIAKEREHLRYVYAEIIEQDERLATAFYNAKAEEYLTAKPKRPDLTAADVKYFPMILDEEDFWTKKDDGQVNIGGV